MTSTDTFQREELVISALSKVILEESPIDSILETVETWPPIFTPLTAAEAAAVREYFAERRPTPCP